MEKMQRLLGVERQRLSAALVVLLALSLVMPQPILAQTKQQPDTTLGRDSAAEQPEWYQTLPPNQPGFPVVLSGAGLTMWSSPTLVDLDGDGHLEILVAGADLVGGVPGHGGMVYAYRDNGSLFWETHVRAPINSTPSAADLNGDGHPDVVVGMGVGGGYSNLPLTGPWNGGVIALDGLTGQELWTFDTQDWLNHSPDGWLDGVVSTPAIGDINGDGQLEIAFGAWDQCIYLLDRFGQPLWGNLPGLLPGQIRCGGHGFYNEDTIWSSPALADVTGDGRLEIIVGADISPGNYWGDPGGGYLYILDANGNTLAREWMDQVIFSSPAVADLDDDGQYEFVVGTGTYWTNKGYYVTAFDYDPAPSNPADRLQVKWRNSTVGRVFASPAIADLDRDGSLDVVITSPVGESGQDGTFVYAWRGSDGASLFQRRACNYMGQSLNTLSSPTVADIDGDNWPEILFSHAWEVDILNHDGTYYTDYSNPQWPGGPQHPGCVRDHNPTTELTYWAQWTLYASPAVGDLDGDGDAEIVIPGHNPSNPNQGMIFAWTGHSVEAAPDWPMWRHDDHHTGNKYFETIPPTNPTSLSSPSHTVGAWSTSNQVQVVWSGAQDQGSGLQGYSIAWDKSADTLPDAIQDLSADTTSTTSPVLADGKGYYFHLRTGDRAGNWTAEAIHLGPFWIDSTLPTSQASSPKIVTGPFQVTWSGNDATSGIRDYTVQVRDGNGPWTTWLANKTDTSASFPGQVGHVYYFRSIARDKAGNVETDYGELGDTQTVVAQYVLQGSVYDQKGEPVSGATVTAQPAALNESLTGSDGRFALGFAGEGVYDLTASHNSYGELLPMEDVVVDSDLDGLAFYLPPAVNLIQNGDFEAPGGWELGGVVAPMPVPETGHTGDCALEVGELPDPPQTPPFWTWAISQTVTLPEEAREATLSWLYRIEGDAQPDDELLVTVHGATAEVSQTLPLDATVWTHSWLDVTDFVGQEVVVTFSLRRAATQDVLTVWLDEVALGTKTGYFVFLPAVRRDVP
jgi:hypothetical protein